MRCINFRILLILAALLTNTVIGHTDMHKQTFELQLSHSLYLNGFARGISGETINYHSPSPDIRSALLVRATTGKMAIEWETDPVILEKDKKFVQYLWLAGLGCNIGEKSFDLFINNNYALTFKSLDKDKWEVEGEQGQNLAFETAMIDNAADRFGLMVLKLPANLVKSGKILNIKIVGQKASSNAWVMTFKDQLREKITIIPANGLLKGAQKRYQPVNLNLIYFGEPVSGVVKIDDEQDQEFNLSGMFNRFTISVPEVQKKTEFNIKIFIDSKQVLDNHIMVEPVRKFTVYMVQHTHTDIGYTRPQTEILPEHLRYIDYALDYCDQTDNYPEDSKFRWTCEASWAVREYIQNRPKQQIQRLRKRVNEGRIELTGMMFNVSDIVDENSYVDFVQALRLFRDNDLSVVTAMQNDVNGFAWCLVDYFKDTGVEYLTMGTHGHKALIAFKHPTPFWMESPAGNRLLAFRADHYMTGNQWGIHAGNLERLETDFFNYLNSLYDTGYPYSEIAVQHSGYLTDNSPPAVASCNLIKKWNEKYEWPKLKTAVARDFMDQMKKQFSSELPVYRAAWPDWWTDGFGSAARETAAARLTHAEMIANLGLLSMAKISGAKLPEHIHERIRVIQDALLFYDEHTFGAAESISDPMGENTQVQWMEKAAYVWDAVKNSRLLTETGMGLIQPFLAKGDVPTITIFNTLNWERSGWLEVYMDNEILPRYKTFNITDENGNSIAAQILSSRSEGNYWALWVNNVPAMGYKTYQINVSDEDRIDEKAYSVENGIIENEYYKLTINAKKGTVSSLFDKQLKKEFVDKECDWELGQFIYETMGYRNQLDRFLLENYERTPLKDISIEAGIDGPLWKSIVINGVSEGFDREKGIRFEIRLFKEDKRIEFHYSIRKERISDPEGVYIAFPFALNNSKLLYEVQGGLVEPGKDQIPGSASDWNTIQNFATVKNDEGQIVIGSSGMPLAQLGGINLGKFQYIAKIEKPHIFSWPLNNYWVTNFRDSQEGELRWSYYFTSSPDNSNSFATKFGWGSRVPLLARVLAPGKSRKTDQAKSFINLQASNLLLVAARPSKDSNGILLHIRELEGKPTGISAGSILHDLSYKSIVQVNVLEEILREIGPSVIFDPYEVKFLKIEL